MWTIDRDRWRVLSPLLDQALELAEDARAAWLDDLRSAHPELAAELTALLAGDAVADERDFLRAPIATATIFAALGRRRRAPQLHPAPLAGERASDD